MGRTFSIARYAAHSWRTLGKKDVAFTAVALLATIVLAFRPTGHEREGVRSLRAKAEVISTENNGIRCFGPVMQGEQTVRVRVLTGEYKGFEADANNILYGKSDLDKVFRPGDRALVVIDPGEKSPDGGLTPPESLTLVDHYRLDAQGALAIAFLAVLLLYGGWTGLKSAVSFAFTVAGIWKLLIPAFLAGFPPVIASLLLVTALSFVIIFLVTGFTETGVAAFLGSMLGTTASAILAMLCAAPYRLNGAVRPFSETLLLRRLRQPRPYRDIPRGTFLASSGAFMDLATDISAALEEIHKKRPGLSFLELAKSGLSVGRKVIGTMSTTLLLAYTGSYTSLLMVFMAQGVPFENMFTMSYVSSEISTR
jgi:uncharacterized membrane protein